MLVKANVKKLWENKNSKTNKQNKALTTYNEHEMYWGTNTAQNTDLTDLLTFTFIFPLVLLHKNNVKSYI